MTPQQKLIAALVAAGAGYYVWHRNTSPAYNRPVPVGASTSGVSGAANVLSTHADAAKDDIKRAGQEISSVMKAHATQASRDASQAKDEAKSALRGESVPAAVVRETPLQASTVQHDPKRVVSTEGGLGERGKQDAGRW